MANEHDVPAFPIVHPQPLGVQYFGMTLRDYFAAAALQGCLSMPWHPEMGCDWRQSMCDRADFAYQQADAMLAARAK